MLLHDNMWELEVENFLTVEHAKIKFGAGRILNVYGNNESGKSSLITALYLITLGSVDANYGDYIRHGAGHFSVSLKKVGEAAPDFCLKHRRTPSGGQWAFNGESVNSKRAEEIRREAFYPLAPEKANVSKLVRPEKFLSVPKQDLVWLLAPTVTNIEEKLEDAINSLNPEHGELLRNWLEQESISLSSLPTLKTAVNIAVEGRRRAKRSLQAVKAISKEIEQWLADNEVDTDPEGVRTRLQEIQAHRESLLEERGIERGKAQQSAFLSVESPADLPFYNNRVLSMEEEALLSLAKEREELRCIQDALRICEEHGAEFDSISTTMEEIEMDITTLESQIAEHKTIMEDDAESLARAEEDLKVAKATSKDLRTHLSLFTMSGDDSTVICSCCGSGGSRNDDPRSGSSFLFNTMRASHTDKTQRLEEAETRVSELTQEQARLTANLYNSRQNVSMWTSRLAEASRQYEALAAASMMMMSPDVLERQQEKVRQAYETAKNLLPTNTRIMAIEEELETLAQERAQLEQFLSAVTVYAEKMRALESSADDIAALEVEIKACDTVAKLLSYDGLLANVLDAEYETAIAGMGDVIYQLTSNCDNEARSADFSFRTGSVYQSVNGYMVPYELQSASAQARSRIALAVAMADVTGFPFVVVDNLELWDELHRMNLERMILETYPGLTFIVLNAGAEAVVGDTVLIERYGFGSWEPGTFPGTVCMLAEMSTGTTSSHLSWESSRSEEYYSDEAVESRRAALRSADF